MKTLSIIISVVTTVVTLLTFGMSATSVWSICWLAGMMYFFGVCTYKTAHLDVLHAEYLAVALIVIVGSINLALAFSWGDYLILFNVLGAVNFLVGLIEKE